MPSICMLEGRDKLNPSASILENPHEFYVLWTSHHRTMFSKGGNCRKLRNAQRLPMDLVVELLEYLLRVLERRLTFPDKFRRGTEGNGDLERSKGTSNSVALVPGVRTEIGVTQPHCVMVLFLSNDIKILQTYRSKHHICWWCNSVNTQVFSQRSVGPSWYQISSGSELLLSPW